jgi:hypothetical protein
VFCCCVLCFVLFCFVLLFCFVPLCAILFLKPHLDVSFGVLKFWQTSSHFVNL